MVHTWDQGQLLMLPIYTRVQDIFRAKHPPIISKSTNLLRSASVAAVQCKPVRRLVFPANRNDGKYGFTTVSTTSKLLIIVVQ